ncbi:hypothetical protein PQQ77_00215 [Paraburkholderia strydomiana]|uniref:hypothetical protein n=1 Tax=Paraburkholderia strydomiana TaxID=1245417 RepID=UPI0038B8C71C
MLACTALNTLGSKHSCRRYGRAWHQPKLACNMFARCDVAQAVQDRAVARAGRGTKRVAGENAAGAAEFRTRENNALHGVFSARSEQISGCQLDIFGQQRQAPLPSQESDLSIPVKEDRRMRAARGVRLYQTMCRSGTLWMRCRSQHDRVTILGETVSGKLTYPGQDWIVEHVGCPHALVKDRLDEARGGLPGGAADIKQCDHVVATVLRSSTRSRIGAVGHSPA